MDSGMDYNKGEKMSVMEFKRVVWDDLQILKLVTAIEAAAIIVLIVQVFGV